MFKALLASIFTVMCIFSTNSSAMMSHQFHTYPYDLSYKVNKYKNYSISHLAPYFRQQGMSFPPREVAFLVFKQEKRLELWARNTGAWHYIRSFDVLAASGGPGPKLRNNDHQVPEGIYHIVGLNPNSLFNLSMELNYPNQFDRAHAMIDGRRDLGNDIFIHGKNRSIGCVAIGDKSIEQLFVLAYAVGIQNVEVIIAPNDLRREAPVYRFFHPRWLPQLYANIRQALMPFNA